MYLIELFKGKQDVYYTYTKRGLKDAYTPDQDCELVVSNVYNSQNGNLFAGKPISWRGPKLLNGGVDINIFSSQEYFIDHITFTQMKGSKFSCLEVLTKTKEGIKKIAQYALPNRQPVSERIVSLPVGVFCDNVTLRFHGAYVGLGFESMEVYATAGLRDEIYPVPKYVSFQREVLPFENIRTISVGNQIATPAAEYFIGLMQEEFGRSLQVSKEGDIIFSLIDKTDDGYCIETTERGCIITAGNKRAFFYAVNSLLQTVRGNGFAIGEIKDEALMDMRGFHLALPSRKDIPFLKKLIKELLVPMRYNMIFLQISGAMRYDNYPEINEKWLESCERYEKGEWPQPAHYGYVGRDVLEKAEVAELCEYIRSFGLEIVPEIESLSHSQYITTAYPFLAEVEEKKAETNSYEDELVPPEFYPHNMCPSHPQYYDYVFGIADEVLEVVKPERFAHMGHDEVYTIGKCKACREKGGAKVYAEEVNRLNEYVKSKNLTMMIWSDMLQKEIYSVPDAISLVDKDVIMLDFTWYFHPEQDLEDRLLNEGFKVMMGNMYSSHYTRYNERSKKKGIVGAEVSTWVACNEQSYAYEGKMYDLVYSANMMWSETYDSEYRLSFNELVKPFLWKIRKRIGEIVNGEKSSIDLGGTASDKYIPLVLLRNVLYKKAIMLSQQNTSVELPIDDYVKGVGFVHATNLPAERVIWTPSKRIGEYVLYYDDGTTYVCGMEYGENICQYGQTYGAPIPSFIFRHEGYMGTYSAKPICGKDEEGNDYTLLEYPINNPYPEKKMQKIIIKHMGNTDANVLIFDAFKIK